MGLIAAGLTARGLGPGLVGAAGACAAVALGTIARNEAAFGGLGAALPGWKRGRAATGRNARSRAAAGLTDAGASGLANAGTSGLADAGTSGLKDAGLKPFADLAATILARAVVAGAAFAAGNEVAGTAAGARSRGRLLGSAAPPASKRGRFTPAAVGADAGNAVAVGAVAPFQASVFSDSATNSSKAFVASSPVASALKFWMTQ
mmetsp:Transcript_114275/g.227395  ORF Transcript_114275/g.227395 Transcript_114275/m.227395 type:complete len:205 (+) Transcript_114275:268-882(+)